MRGSKGSVSGVKGSGQAPRENPAYKTYILKILRPPFPRYAFLKKILDPRMIPSTLIATGVNKPRDQLLVKYPRFKIIRQRTTKII